MKKVKTLVAIATFAFASVSLAQPGTTVGSGSGQPGGVVSIPIGYLGTGSGVVGVQMDVNFDNTNLTANIGSCGGTLGGANITCTDNGTFIRLIGFDGALNEIPSGSLGTIDFTIGGGVVPPASFPITVSGELYGDNVGAGVAPSGTVNGQVDAVAISPIYTSTPVAGTAIDLGQILQGGTNPSSSIDIDNTGDPGTDLTGTCSIAAPFSITGGTAAFNVAENAASDHTVTFECDASTAPGMYTQALSCTHNGSNMSPATYDVDCEVLAAAAAGDQNPANGTALNIVVAPGGSANASVTFTEIGGQGVDITDLNCAVTPGVGFAVTSPGAFPATVPAAGSLPVIVTFTDPGDGSATPGSLDCTYTDGAGAQAVSYPLSFIIRAVNVPSMNMIGYLVLTLGLGLLGFWSLRRKA